jgi:hypothetical protein
LKIKPLTRREKYLLLALLLTLTILTGWRFLLGPYREKSSALQIEYDSLIGEQSRLIQVLEKQGQARSPQRIPFLDEMPRVLADLEDLIRRSPVDLILLESTGLEYQAGYAALGLRLKVAGPARGVLRLIRELEQFTHLSIVDSLDWTGQDDRITMEIFFHQAFFDPEQ